MGERAGKRGASSGADVGPIRLVRFRRTGDVERVTDGDGSNRCHVALLAR